MNDLTTQADNAPPVPAAATMFKKLGLDPRTPIALQVMFDGDLMSRMEYAAKIMAGSQGIAAHVKGNIPTCFQIISMALTMNLDPYFLANETFDPGGGKLAMTSRLIHVILENSGYLKDAPSFEFVGDWTQVQGKWATRTSQKSGKEFFAATYTEKDEEGLGIIVTIPWTDRDPFVSPVLRLRDMQPRFSVQWAINPMAQMPLAALRKAVRMSRPSLLMGRRFEEDVELYDHIGPDKAKPINGDRDTGDRSPTSQLDAFAGAGVTDVEDEAGQDSSPAAPDDKPAASDSAKAETASNVDSKIARGTGSADPVYSMSVPDYDSFVDQTGVPTNWNSFNVKLSVVAKAFRKAFADAGNEATVQALLDKNMDEINAMDLESRRAVEAMAEAAIEAIKRDR